MGGIAPDSSRFAVVYVTERAHTVERVEADDLEGELIVLASEPGAGAVCCEDLLPQQREAGVAVDCERRFLEAKSSLEVPDHLFENGVLVVEVRHVGEYEMKVDLFSPGPRSLRSNVSDDLRQAAEILFVREEENDDGVREVARTDAADIGMTRAGVE